MNDLDFAKILGSLPDLAPPPEKLKLDPVKALFGQDQPFYYNKGLAFDLSPKTKLKLNTKGLGIQGDQYNVLVGLGGDWKAGGSVPLFGGTLSGNVESKDDQKRYGLQFRKDFK